METNPSADIDIAVLGLAAEPVVDVDRQPLVRFAILCTDGTSLTGYLPSDEARLVSSSIDQAAAHAESDAHLFALVAELDTPELAATILAELRDRRRTPPSPPQEARQ